MKKRIVKKTIEYDLANIPNRFFKRVGKTMQYIQFFYHNTAEVKEYRDIPLPTEEFPFAINRDINLTLQGLKEESYKWLLKKALEDFILGINLSLVEANNFLFLYNESNKSKVKPEKTYEEIEIGIGKNDKKINGLHLPTLIKEIEEYLEKDLPYKDEIKSINKIRACFVHRDGCVHSKDINNKENNILTLKWVEFLTEIELSKGKWVESSYDLRKDGVNVQGVRRSLVNKKKSFAEEDLIELNFDILNGIGCTCILFTQELAKETMEKVGFKVSPRN